MTKPTIHELLEAQHMDARIQPMAVNERMALLAERVEAVLALAAKRHAAEAYDAALRDVLRALNGEQP